MRRVQSACLEQTLRFSVRDPMNAEEAARLTRAEYDQYKMDLDRKKVLYKITDESVQPDGSLIVRIKKQYNAHSVGDYLD